MNNKLLYDTKYLQLKSSVSKTGREWVYAHRPNASNVVVILPVINNEKILFLKEERPPMFAENIGKYSIGFPAGLVGDERKGESVLDAIRAELLEETGMVADRIEINIENVASSPGCVSEIFTIATAYITDYSVVQKPLNDGGIIIDRILVNKNRVNKWLSEQQKEGIIITGQVLAALYYLDK